MKHRGIFHVLLMGLFACLAVANTSPVRAEKPSPARKILGRTRSVMLGPKLRVQPGTWVAYIVTATPPKEVGFPKWEMRVKISLPIHADVEHPLGEGQFWMEFEFADPAMQKQDLFVALKMLLEGDPRDKKSLKRAYIAAGSRLPMELPEKYFGESGAGLLQG